MAKCYILQSFLWLCIWVICGKFGFDRMKIGKHNLINCTIVKVTQDYTFLSFIWSRASQRITSEHLVILHAPVNSLCRAWREFWNSAIERAGSQIYFVVQRPQIMYFLEHHTCVCYLFLHAEYIVAQVYNHNDTCTCIQNYLCFIICQLIYPTIKSSNASLYKTRVLPNFPC